MSVHAVCEAVERLQGTDLDFQLLSAEFTHQLGWPLLNMSPKA